MRDTFLMMLAVALLLGGCTSTSTGGSGAAPDWALDETAGLDADRVLVGVARQPGHGPESADAAKQKAVGRLVAQIVANVSAESTLTDDERTTYTLEGGRVEQLTVDEDTRQRLITITAEADLSGIEYEVVPATEARRPVTYARAIVDRDALANVYASQVRQSLTVARRGAQLGRGSLSGAAGPEGLVAAVRGRRALDEPRAVLPVLVGLRPRSGVGLSLLAEHGSLEDELTEILHESRERLELVVTNGPVRVSLSGQVPPLDVRALWDGAPLAGLPVGLRAGEATAAQGVTGVDGRVRLDAVEPTVATSPAKLGLAVDDVVEPLAGATGLVYPAAINSRVLVHSVHERDGREMRSPLHGDLADQLTRMHFRVLTMDDPGGAFDYVLEVKTVTEFSSESSTAPGDLGRAAGRLYWYRTDLVATLTERTTGESLALAVERSDTKAVGRTRDQGARHSLELAYRRLLDPSDADALPALLRSRFTIGEP
jgi:hypothetical protein